MLTCREFADFLLDYDSGTLPAPRMREFERHLSLCSACVEYLESYRKTIRLGRAAFSDEDVPPDIPEDLVRAILAARAQSS